MIVLDTSAVIAIMNYEPYRDALIETLGRDRERRMSARLFVECAQVSSRNGDHFALARLDDFLRGLMIALEPFTAAHAHVARDAFLKFGKGRGHPAQLNQMDCIAYALAKSLDAPLRFIGKALAHTDVRPALAPGGD